MDRQAYNACMSPYIKGSGKTPEQRKLDFCTGAKVCSGKAKSDEEAKQICLTQPPAEKKPKKKRAGKSCDFDPQALADCLIPDLEEGISPSKLTKLIARCTGAAKPSKKAQEEEAQAAEVSADEEKINKIMMEMMAEGLSPEVMTADDN